MSLNRIIFITTPQNPEPHFYINGLLYTYKDAGLTEVPRVDIVYLVTSSFFRLAKKGWFRSSLYCSKIINYDWATIIVPFFKKEDGFEIIVNSIEDKIKDFSFGFEFNSNFEIDCTAFNQTFYDILENLYKKISKDFFTSDQLECFKDKTVYVTGTVSKESYFNLSFISVCYEVRTDSFKINEPCELISGTAYFLVKSNDPLVVDYNYASDCYQEKHKSQTKKLTSFSKPKAKKLKLFNRYSKYV